GGGGGGVCAGLINHHSVTLCVCWILSSPLDWEGSTGRQRDTTGFNRRLIFPSTHSHSSSNNKRRRELLKDDNIVKKGVKRQTDTELIKAEKAQRIIEKNT